MSGEPLFQPRRHLSTRLTLLLRPSRRAIRRIVFWAAASSVAAIAAVAVLVSAGASHHGQAIETEDAQTVARTCEATPPLFQATVMDFFTFGYSAPIMGTTRVLEFSRGAVLDVVSEQGGWLEVRNCSTRVWVQADSTDHGA